MQLSPTGRIAAAQVFWGTGAQLVFLASQLRMFEVTGSSADVGRLTASAIVPILATALVIPRAIHRFGPRNVAGVAHVFALMGIIPVIGLGFMEPRTTWPLYLVASCWGVGTAAIVPSRLVSIPLIAPAETLAKANSQFVAANYGAILGGPALSALLLGKFNTLSVFVAAGVRLLGSGMLPVPRVVRSLIQNRGESSLRALLSYMRIRSVSRLVLMVDLIAMLLSSPRVFLPAIGLSFGAFGGSVASILFGAVAVGGLASMVFFRAASRQIEPAVGTLKLAGMWGALCVTLGVALLSTSIPAAARLSLVLLCLLGAGLVDGILGTIRQTAVQSHEGVASGATLQTWALVLGTVGPRLGAILGEISVFLGRQRQLSLAEPFAQHSFSAR